MFELLILVVIIIIFYFKYVKNSDIKSYKSINFTNKKIFLCINYLYGPLKIKTNKGVISKHDNFFLLEVEDDDGNIENMTIDKSNILNIEIKNRPSFKSTNGYYSSFSSSDHIGPGANADEIYQKTKIKQIYEIKITLTTKEIICMECKKNPYSIFND